MEKNAVRPRRPKRPGRCGARMSTSNETLPRAPGASAASSCSGIALQNTAGVARRGAGDARRSAPAAASVQPLPPLPQSRIQIRSSGDAPGFVNEIVSRPVQWRPCSEPLSATS